MGNIVHGSQHSVSRKMQSRWAITHNDNPVAFQKAFENLVAVAWLTTSPHKPGPIKCASRIGGISEPALLEGVTDPEEYNIGYEKADRKMTDCTHSTAFQS